MGILTYILAHCICLYLFNCFFCPASQGAGFLQWIRQYLWLVCSRVFRSETDLKEEMTGKGGAFGSVRIWGQTRSDTVTDALLKLCLEGVLKVTQLLVMIDDASEVTMGKHYDWSSRSRLSSDMQFPKSFPTLLFTRTNECTGYLPDNDQPLPELLASCAGRAVESWPKKWWMRTFSVGRSEFKLTANASCMHVLCLSCPLRTFVNLLCERNNPFPLHWHAVL